jgi:DNA polymerase III epsilon subunit-like protein
MKLLVIDTETGGLNPQQHALLELAAQVVVVRGGSVSRGPSFVAKIWPDRPVLAEAARVNGFSHARWAESKSLMTSIGLFDEFVQRYGAQAMLCGHNIAFDAAFLREAYAVCEREYPFSHRMLCTQSLSGLDLLGGRVTSTSLAAMTAHYGIENKSAHSAWSDCDATVELLGHLLQRYRYEVSQET